MRLAPLFVPAFGMAIALFGALAEVPAHADAPVPLGGGSGIVVDGDTFCTLTTIGHDNRGKLVGFTSAHCGGPGHLVAAEGAENRGTLGVMVAGSEPLDYAVIEFDPAKVQPLDNVNGFQIDGIGPDPTFGEVACKLGRTTGSSCGVTWGPGQDPGTIVAQVMPNVTNTAIPIVRRFQDDLRKYGEKGMRPTIFQLEAYVTTQLTLDAMRRARSAIERARIAIIRGESVAIVDARHVLERTAAMLRGVTASLR